MITDQFNSSSIDHLNNSEKMMFYDIMFTFSNGILCKLDRAAMHTSLETRLPFINLKLNKFALNLPNKYKINNFETKYILKKLLKKLYKNNIFSKNKTGFGAPFSSWLRKDLKNWSKEIIFNGDQTNLLDKDFFIAAWNNHQKGYDNSQIIWNNIMFNLWSYKK